MHSKIRETADYIRARCNLAQPVLGLILGSGLDFCSNVLDDGVIIPFSDLPDFPVSRVAGHPGNLIIGVAEGIPLIVLQGRVHLYEGFSPSEVTFPVRVLGCLGIRRLIITNAAGGINPDFQPGDFMLIADHINLTGANPLVGTNVDELGPRFPDMSEAYDSGMRKAALDAARSSNVSLHEGVYIGFCGPSYETPAEIRMCRTLGADAVGMSTVLEVIVARHMGIRVLGISCITNTASGIRAEKLSHVDVLNTAESAREEFLSLLREIIRQPQLIAC